MGAGDLVGEGPAGDRLGAAGSPSLATGPGRGERGRRPAPLRLRAPAGRGGPGSHLRGRVREGVPAAATTVAPGVELRPLQTRGGDPGRAAAPTDVQVPWRPPASEFTAVPAAEPGALTRPSHTGAERPLSAKLVSLFPPFGTRICRAAVLAPSGLPRPARRASPGEPAGATPRAAPPLSAVPEPPQLLPATRGEPSVVSADRLKQRNHSRLGRSVAPRRRSARGWGAWGLGNCPAPVQGRGSWNARWPLAWWVAQRGDCK